ncbi:MAG TPA: hypothetical protein VJ952_06770 [Opitutales bacterium]|nr:hypothetical protein [Opitutales bacterium]
MELFSSRHALLVFTALISSAAWSQEAKDVDKSRQFTPKEIYEPRYPDRTCPPEYPWNREIMEELLRGKSPQNFREQYGAPIPDSISDVEVLGIEEDLEACRYFNERYKEKINLQYRLSENGMAWYMWDFTYYKSEDFYFVVRGGGSVEEDVPEKSGWIRSVASTSRVPPVTIFLREDFFQVPFWN